MAGLSLSDRTYTLRDFIPFLEGPHWVHLTPQAKRQVNASHERLSKALSSGVRIYGVTTGFGDLSQVDISAEDQRQLQLNLVRSHAAGVGEPLEPGLTRLVMALKTITLLRGYSGVRLAVLDQLVDFLNQDLLPVIPSQGSVGASGDLTPLAHLALALIGEGKVSLQGRILPSLVALKEVGLTPLLLEPKEGLSLINGTQVSTALAVKALIIAHRLLQIADVVGALSVEGSLCTAAVFNPHIHALKRHPGQQLVAKNLWELLEESEIVRSHQGCDRVQDPYSFRCLPHIHGTARDVFSAVKTTIVREINSVSDNPLILKDGEVVTSGHFHAEPVAQAMDNLAITMAEVGAMSERRTHFFMKGISPAVPPFVASNPGLESGYMMAHVTAAALASENKTLAHPASVDSLPTSAGQEDIVSMAPWAGRKCLQVLTHVAQILAIELLVSSTAIAKFHFPKKCGKGTSVLMDALQVEIRIPQGDVPLQDTIQRLSELILAGKLIEPVKKAVNLE
jgi:histidine ammonia-lyase